MEKEGGMIDVIKKTILTGIGVAFMTKDKIVELSKELVEKGKMSEKEGKEFVEELLRKSDKARKEIEAQIEKIVKETLRKMNIATRDEVKELEEKVQQLLEKHKDEGHSS